MGEFCLAHDCDLDVGVCNYLAPAPLSHQRDLCRLIFGVRVACSWITGDPWRSEISPIAGPMYQLFIFFMITDPRTTVRSKTGQCVVVVAVAAVEMVLRLHQVVYAPFYALFLVGATAMLLEMWMDSRRARLLVAHA